LLFHLFQLNKFFYKNIGKNHKWVDRLTWSEEKWIHYVSNESVRSYVFKFNDDLVGFFELIFHPEKNETEIAYFGILEEYQNKKLGSFLLSDAIKKANEMARRKLIHIPLREGRTIHHDVKAKDGSGRIVLRAASKGTGIIAGGPVRAVCEVLGVKDIVAKSMGTSNAHNVIRATMKALLKQNSPKQISSIRNKKISEIIEKRG